MKEPKTIEPWRLVRFDRRHIQSIEQHYRNAVEKHPHFADTIVPKFITDGAKERRESTLEHARKFLKYMRNENAKRAKRRELSWIDLADCEQVEVLEAYIRGDMDAAAEEAYDAIAVLLRLVDVLEGRQTLGKPGKGKGKGKGGAK